MVSFQFLTVLILQIDARLTDIDSPTIDTQVNKMDILNICGDPYSQVDIGLYRTELNQSASNVMLIVWWFFVLVFCGLLSSVPPIALAWNEAPDDGLNVGRVGAEPVLTERALMELQTVATE